MVIDFDGPNGVIIVDRDWLTAGEGKTEHGKYLYNITSNTNVFRVDKPDVYYIRIREKAASTRASCYGLRP